MPLKQLLRWTRAKKAIKMWDQGWSVVTIAKELNLNEKSIRRYLKKGLTLTPYPRQSWTKCPCCGFEMKSNPQPLVKNPKIPGLLPTDKRGFDSVTVTRPMRGLEYPNHPRKLLRINWARSERCNGLTKGPWPLCACKDWSNHNRKNKLGIYYYFIT